MADVDDSLVDRFKVGLLFLFISFAFIAFLDVKHVHSIRVSVDFDLGSLSDSMD